MFGLGFFITGVWSLIDLIMIATAQFTDANGKIITWTVWLICRVVEIVADATIVGRCTDATLFIIRAENLDRRLLPDVQKYYDDNRLPKMSIILNGTNEGFSYYGSNRYGSRYGYYGGSAYGGYTKDDD